MLKVNQPAKARCCIKQKKAVLFSSSTSKAMANKPVMKVKLSKLK